MNLIASSVSSSPVWEGRGGHPLLIAGDDVNTVYLAESNAPLSSLIEREKLDVDFPFLHLNIDTEADLEELFLAAKEDWFQRKSYVWVPRGATMTAKVLAWVLEQLQRNSPVVLATVVGTKGSVPGKSGARLAMNRFQDWVGTVGGAGLEHRILNRCKELIGQSKATSEVHTFGLNKGAKGYEVQPLDSLCGGQVTISLELMLPMPHVLLMGGGHCSEAISKLLPKKGWNYSVQDTREAFTTAEIYPEAVERHHATVADFFSGESEETLTRFSDILQLGHDYAEDLDRLQRLLQLAETANVSLDGKAFPRIGAIGSRSKWKSFTESCIDVGIQSSTFDQVRCPIGLNIGAESPEEIAIAVIAEILSMHKDADVHAPNWRDQ